MRTLPQPVYILSAKRTPFGTFCGSLKAHTATDLGVLASQAALDASGVDREDIDHVVFGNAAQTSKDAIYLARHIGLRSDIPQAVPALTLNRLCGSGFQAVITGAEQILTGQADLVLTGGTESMTQAPHVVRGARTGLSLGKSDLEDSLWTSLSDPYVDLLMAMTAENLAVKYEISQDEVDEYSAETQRRFAAAQEAGYFDAELAAVEVKERRKVTSFDTDEHGRPGTTVEALRKLPKVFKKDGVIHAGAASGICDGAAALVIASEAYVKRTGAKTLAKISGWGISGCDPTIMGIGPVPAIQRALKHTDSKLSDFDLVEINEAFAPQVLACKKALEVDGDKLNVNGGAIAVGHPLAASGARITAHLVHELRRRGNRHGIGSACIGGGQGIALAVESTDGK